MQIINENVDYCWVEISKSYLETLLSGCMGRVELLGGDMLSTWIDKSNGKAIFKVEKKQDGFHFYRRKV